MSRFRAFPIALAFLLATPHLAIAQSPAATVPHTHQTVTTGVYVATFHFNAPTNPMYTCPLHPDVTSTLPFSTCPSCQLELQLQTHTIGLAINGADGQPITVGQVKLDVANKQGKVQHLDLPFSGYFQASLYLAAGLYKLTAHFKPQGSTAWVVFKTDYLSP